MKKRLTVALTSNFRQIYGDPPLKTSKNSSFKAFFRL